MSHLKQQFITIKALTLTVHASSSKDQRATCRSGQPCSVVDEVASHEISTERCNARSVPFQDSSRQRPAHRQLAEPWVHDPSEPTTLATMWRVLCGLRRLPGLLVARQKTVCGSAAER